MPSHREGAKTGKIQSMKKCCFILFWVLLITAVIFPPFAAAGLVNGPDWSIAGTGDFDGGEIQGILWRNQATGDLAFWYMHGGALVSEQQLESAPGSAWDVVGLGDFNGDGIVDFAMKFWFGTPQPVMCGSGT